MRPLFTIVVLLVVISCNYNKQSLNFDDQLINKYFTEKDRASLRAMVKFVDSLIMIDNPSQDIEKGYHYYFDSVYNKARYNHVSVAFDEEIKYSFLFSLDSSLFQKIWIKYVPRRISYLGTSFTDPPGLYCIDLVNDGAFNNLLEELGKENELYKWYSEHIREYGSTTPFLYGEFPNDNHKFNFNNVYDRLWAVIFLLSAEESADLKINRYLRNQETTFIEKSNTTANTR